MKYGEADAAEMQVRLALAVGLRLGFAGEPAHSGPPPQSRILITHDVGEAIYLGDRVLVTQPGPGWLTRYCPGGLILVAKSAGKRVGLESGLEGRLVNHSEGGNHSIDPAAIDLAGWNYQGSGGRTANRNDAGDVNR